MTRARRLQSQDENGEWYSEAYAIESPEGAIIFHYPFWWEHIGGQYAYQIKESRLPLEHVEQILHAPKLKWLPVEKLDLTFEQAIELLDTECHIPRLKKKVAAPA